MDLDIEPEVREFFDLPLPRLMCDTALEMLVVERPNDFEFV